MDILRRVGKRPGILAAYRSLAKGRVGESIGRRYLSVLYSRGGIKVMIEKPILIKDGHERVPDCVIFYGKWYCPMIVEIKFGRIHEETVRATVEKYSGGYLHLPEDVWFSIKHMSWRTRRCIRRRIVPVGIIMISIQGEHTEEFREEMFLRYGVILLDRKHLFRTIRGIRDMNKYIRSALIQNIDQIATRLEKKYGGKR